MKTNNLSYLDKLQKCLKNNNFDTMTKFKEPSISQLINKTQKIIIKILK